MADMLRADLAAARLSWIVESGRHPEQRLAREPADSLETKNHAG